MPTSCFWQVVDHWQTLIAGGFALVAGGIAYIAGLQQAHATTRSARNQLAAAARRDRLQAHCIAVAVYPELLLLQVLHERASNIIANNFPSAEGQDATQISTVVRDARIRIPPFLNRNIDNLFIIEPAGATLLQLISLTMRYNDMVEKLVNDIQNRAIIFSSATHQQELSGVLTLISTTLEMAMSQIEPVHAEVTEG